MIKLQKAVLFAAMAVATSAHAGSIYGLAQEGGIYKINTANGAASKVYTTSVSGARGQYNGLAFDGSTFYYANGANFYKNAGSETKVTVSGFQGSNANGFYYNGAYTYVSGTNTVKSLNVTTKAITTTTISNLISDFGDSVADGHGNFYSSLNSGGFQKYTLGATTATSLVANNLNTGALQLGFDESGSLYGVNYDSGKIYSINTATGARTWTGGTVSGLHITDAASNVAATPEPFTSTLAIAGIGAIVRRRRASK